MFRQHYVYTFRRRQRKTDALTAALRLVLSMSMLQQRLAVIRE